MAAKTGWHRYGTKLRHCHPVYSDEFTVSKQFARTTRFCSPNDISIGSAVFAGRKVVTDVRVDHATPSLAMARLQLSVRDAGRSYFQHVSTAVSPLRGTW